MKPVVQMNLKRQFKGIGEGGVPGDNQGEQRTMSRYKKRKGSKSDLLPFAKVFRLNLITSSF
ncbi:MAG TPA: hypothetical protein VFO54_02335 [Chryseosolibacter sp.]|nr:hypothetical protein [Chryseosolibacter sp.]